MNKYIIYSNGKIATVSGSYVATINHDPKTGRRVLCKLGEADGVDVQKIWHNHVAISAKVDELLDA